MGLIAALLAGVIFGLGIVLAGMANPAKILNFFDVAGSWDPSLAFVMGGALAVTFLGYRLVLRRPAPMCDSQFHLPKAREIDRPLVLGSMLFGIGWGIAGFCPGGAIPALGMGQPKALIFVVTMLVGILLARCLRGPVAAMSKS